MDTLIEDLSKEERGRLAKRRMPGWTMPTLATLTKEPFDDPRWIYERKLDGVRLLAFKQAGETRLLSRNRNDDSATWPEVVEELDAMDRDDFLVDGEVVTFDGSVTSFSRLQARTGLQDPEEARRTGIPVYYYLFDLLHLGGYDTTDLPLRARKSLLKRALDFSGPIRFTPHRNGAGVAYWESACRKGWEGVIAKDATAGYVHGRTRSWQKFKCTNRQELVVGGFTDPRGERAGFGALLLGYYDDDQLRYAGKVGTGWDERELRDLRSRLEGIQRKSSPFGASGDVPGSGVHWVRPRIVAEIGFTEWTRDGRLRHPRWIGERRDKEPEAVVKEEHTA